MKKTRILTAAILGIAPFVAYSQEEGSDNPVINIEGVDLLTYTYAEKMSLDGNAIVGESVDAGTVYYNRATGELYYYPEGDFGRGYVMSDNGWVVGTQQINDEFNHAVIMANGETWTPSVFPTDESSNIHSITPDGSRICGVVGANNIGYTNRPFYCDIDENGNVGQIQYLPFPERDFFGHRPQFCTANWMSEDGKTILGQMIDNTGFFVSPVIYRQANDGTWSCSLPSENQFNPEGRPLPEPLGSFEEVFPDAVYPDVQNFMSASEYARFLANGQPYEELDQYMDPDQMAEYTETYYYYLECQMDYEDLLVDYTLAVYEIVDESVFYVRNAQALSSDGKWLAASAQVDILVEGEDTEEYMGFYIPYLCNLETMEWTRLVDGLEVLHVNQVLPGGIVFMSTLMGEAVPARTFLYFDDTKEFTSIYDYIAEQSPEYGAWYMENLTGDVPVGIDPSGGYIYETVTITGNVVANKDFTKIAGGVDLYALGGEMYATYFMDNLMAGVEEIREEALAEQQGVTVYNLQGVKVLESKTTDGLSSLPRGIYIINGKKTLIK